MGRGLQGALLRSFGGRDHEATVLEISRVAPHFVRITMSSPTMFEDAVVEPTAFLRFWFPDPEGSDSEFQRIYTIVWTEPESGRFAVDVVLHEPSGPASHWAARAEPGMTLPVVCAGFQGFRGSRRVACRLPAHRRFGVHTGHQLDPGGASGRRRCRGVPGTPHHRRRTHPDHRPSATATALGGQGRRARPGRGHRGSGLVELVRMGGPRGRARSSICASGYARRSDSRRADLHAQAYWTQGREMGSRRDSEDKPRPTVATNGASPATSRSAHAVRARDAQAHPRDGGVRRPPRICWHR